MISILSPAKSMTVTKEDIFTSTPESLPNSELRFPKESADILEKMKAYSTEDIGGLMSVSKKIAQLNYDRFQNYDRLSSKQALLAFDGDVYTSMTRDTYSTQDFTYAQKHLRILSGLYGMLMPLDTIKPYRLEMSTKLKDIAPQGMAKYWQNEVTTELNKQLSKQKNPVLINLASNEYSSAINFNKLDHAFLNIHFREYRDNKLRNIAINAKRARGMVADYIIKNQIDTADSLLNFSDSGYRYDEKLSDDNNLFFVREI